MKNFTSFAFSAAVLLTLPMVANAAPAKFIPSARARSERSAGFNSGRIEKINAINSKMFSRSDAMRGPAVEADKYSPSVLGPSSSWGDLDGPDGKVWFYSIDIESDAIQHEYYTEYVSRHWVLHIFDENLQPVATLQDDVHYQEGEKRTVLLEPLPIITKNYFNSDSKYEVVMSFGINFTPGHNHYRSVVYQIDGETDANGNAMPLYSFDELFADVVRGDEASEEVYMTILRDNAYIPEEFDWESVQDTDDFWKHYCTQNAVFEVYRKAGDMTEPQLILSKPVAYANFPGTQESSPFISLSHDGKAYITVSYYKEPFFNPFYSWTEDFSQREENSLMVDVYHLSEQGATLVQQTEIPFAKNDEDLLAKYYSIGDLRYWADFNFSDFDTDGKAALYITESRQNRGEESPSSFSYFLYNPDGSIRSTIFEGAESHLAMADLEGFEPQELFVTSEYGEYIFNFVDLLSARKTASFSYLLEIDEDSDPDGMTVNIDRVKQGSKYAYVDEMRMPIDVDDYTWLRVAWLSDKGEFDHIDYVNMGANVHYAMCYLTEPVLHPDFYHSDDAQEYMMLIKRGKTDPDTGEEIRVEELLVAQPVSEEYPDGRDVLYLPENPHGPLSNIMPFIASDNPMLNVAYYNRESGKYLCEYYPLPLDRTVGIDSVTTEPAPAEAAVSGVCLGVYNLHGVRVADAASDDAINALPAGVYVVKTDSGASKFVKK